MTASVILPFVDRVLQYNFLSSHVFLQNQREQSCICIMGREDLLSFLQSHHKPPKSLFFFTNMTYKQQVTSISEHICNFLICNSNTEFELLWIFHDKKRSILDLTSLVSTDNSLHGRSSTGSSDSTGPSQDPEKNSSPQSTEHLWHNTSSSWETRCTENCQDYLVSRCHITCQEVSDFSNKGSLYCRTTIPLLEIWPSNPAQLLCITCCIQDDWNTFFSTLLQECYTRD